MKIRFPSLVLYETITAFHRDGRARTTSALHLPWKSKSSSHRSCKREAPPFVVLHWICRMVKVIRLLVTAAPS